jgi:hypothetical protein
MCAGGIAGQQMAKGNYGFTSAEGPSPIAQDERQWYIDQGFGDPNEVIGARRGSARYVSGRNQMPAVNPYAGSYRGVSPEARYLYKQSLVPKPAPAAAQPAPVPTLAVPPATTRWAGNALTINPMSS